MTLSHMQKPGSVMPDKSFFSAEKYWYFPYFFTEVGVGWVRQRCCVSSSSSSSTSSSSSVLIISFSCSQYKIKGVGWVESDYTDINYKQLCHEFAFIAPALKYKYARTKWVDNWHVISVTCYAPNFKEIQCFSSIQSISLSVILRGIYTSITGRFSAIFTREIT